MIEAINKIVYQAGQIALGHFGKVEFSYKADKSIVTIADVEVEKYLLRKLTDLIPGSAFLGEEGVADNQDIKTEYLWIVDPIDGTSSFCAGLPIWGVSVALFKNQKPFLASMYFPRVNSFFWADENGKAFEDGNLINNLASNSTLEPQKFVCIPSHTYYRCNLKINIKSRSFGSTCYHLLQAARGSAFAAIIGNCQIWDIAGAMTVAKITGAELFNLKAEKISVSTYLQLGLEAEPIILCYPDRLPKLLEHIKLVSE